MAETSKISWTNGTFNPWHGCVRVSPGCEHCYAESLSKRWGKEIWGPAATTDRQMMSEAYWRGPVNWNRKAEQAGVPYKVFSGSMCDIMEDHPQVEEARQRLFRLIEATPWLIWQLLTKRPENYVKYLPIEWYTREFPRNVWLGTSVENQDQAEKRIPFLWENTFAPVFWLSYEPALGPINLRTWLATREQRCEGRLGIDWVVIGGESGPGARPFNLTWASDTIDQCRAYGAAPFVKQMGSKPIWPWTQSPFAVTGKGDNPEEWPGALQVQEFPWHPTPAQEVR